MIYGRVFSVYHIPHLIFELVISQIKNIRFDSEERYREREKENFDKLRL